MRSAAVRPSNTHPHVLTYTTLATACALCRWLAQLPQLPSHQEQRLLPLDVLVADHLELRAATLERRRQHHAPHGAAAAAAAAAADASAQAAEAARLVLAGKRAVAAYLQVGREGVTGGGG